MPYTKTDLEIIKNIIVGCLLELGNTPNAYWALSECKDAITRLPNDTRFLICVLRDDGWLESYFNTYDALFWTPKALALLEGE